MIHCQVAATVGRLAVICVRIICKLVPYTCMPQTSFFFGYNAVVCYAFFLMLGAVGLTASLTFVRHIYRAIKCE